MNVRGTVGFEWFLGTISKDCTADKKQVWIFSTEAQISTHSPTDDEINIGRRQKPGWISLIWAELVSSSPPSQQVPPKDWDTEMLHTNGTLMPSRDRLHCVYRTSSIRSFLLQWFRSEAVISPSLYLDDIKLILWFIVMNCGKWEVKSKRSYTPLHALNELGEQSTVCVLVFQPMKKQKLELV